MGKFFRFLQAPRGRTAMLLLAIGAVGAGLVMVFYPNQHEHVGHVLLEVSAAVLIVGVVDLLTKLVAIRMEMADREDFERFFGRHAVREGATVIFPTAKPVTVSPVTLAKSRIAADLNLLRSTGLIGHPEDGNTLPIALADSRPSAADNGTPEQHCALEYEDPPEAAAKARAKGIECIVPFEDLEEITRLFNQMDCKCHIDLDRGFSREDAPLPQRPLIAVGLGFNHVTTKISHLCPKLFEITYNTGTDDFTFGKQPHPCADAQEDFALVVRALDHGRSGSPVVHLVCAGRTASGTEAAGLFLANHWKDLLRLYDRGHDLTQDSLAVLLKFRKKNAATAVVSQVLL